MRKQECDHNEIIIVEGYRENHSCWYDDYPSTATCVKCGHYVTDEYSIRAFNNFVNGKKVIERRRGNN